MKFSFTSSSSWLLLVVATPSALVVAKRGKKTKNTKNENTVVPVDNDNDNDSNDNVGPILGGGANLNCDPMYFTLEPDCKNNDCASTINWEDGCEACICVTMIEMPPGVMEKKVRTMTCITLKMERTHLVIAIRETGNAIQFFFHRVLLAIGIGSVRVGWDGMLVWCL